MESYICPRTNNNNFWDVFMLKYYVLEWLRLL
jgi:hypothetical protein